MNDARSEYRAKARAYRTYLRQLVAISRQYETRSSNVDPVVAAAKKREAMRNVVPVDPPPGFTTPYFSPPCTSRVLLKDKARQLRAARNEIIRRADELIFDLEHGFDFRITYQRSVTNLAQEVMRLTKRNPQ